MLTTLRFAARSLLRARAYSFTSIGTLSLSIAALALAAAFANAFFFRPMPFRNDHELVGISSTRRAANGEVVDFAVSSADYLAYSARNKTMVRLAAINSQSYALMVGDLPESIEGAMVSATMWPLLGTSPIAGRVFSEAEDVKGATIVVISERLGRRLFPAGADSALGQTIRLNGAPLTVIGVMPAGFRPRMNPGDVWIPMGVTATSTGAVTRQMQVVGRLKPGISVEAAVADVQGIAASLATELADHKDWGASVKPLRAKIGDTARPIAITLLAAVSFLLILTAANLANLAVARTARQRADISTRFALGASRSSIMRHQAAEALLLALAGAAGGIVLARLLLPATLALMTSDNPLLPLVAVDWRVIACVVAIAAITGLAGSMLPSAYAVRAIGHDALASGGRRAVAGVKERRLRKTLMSVQVSAAAILLIGSLGAVVALGDAASHAVGFDPKGVVAARVTLQVSRYPTIAERNKFTSAVVERLTQTPGIAAAAMTTSRFIPGASIQGSFTIEGQPADAPTIAAEVRRVDGEYFGVMKIPLQEGRLFTTADRDSMPPVVIVNRRFVTQYLAGRQPLGTRIIRGTNRPATIVGVVPDVRDGGQAENIGAMVYLPFKQSAAAFATFVTRSTLPPGQVERLVREAVRSIDPTQPFDRIAPLEQYLSESLGEERFKTVLLGSLAVLAVLVACLGIYGVTSYLMAERAREVAIKLALGAAAGRLLREFVVGSAVTVGVSAAVGVVLSVFARIVLARWIGEAGSLPPLLYPLVLALLLVIGTLAAWMPAWKASRTEPGTALRA